MNKTPRDVKKSRFSKYYGRFQTVHGLVEMAVLVALAIVLDLDFAKIRVGAGAGMSLSLTMLPLLIIALRFPVFDSFIGIGIVYGLATNLLDGYGIITYPLDYLLAYGSLALVSLFRTQVFAKRNKIFLNYLFLAIAVLSGVAARIFWSTISGVVVYEYTLGGSLLYNVPTIGGSGLASLFVLIMLYQTLVVLNKQVEPYFAEETTENQNEDPSL